MMKITQIKLGEGNTRLEALEVAKGIIAKWSKENDVNVRLCDELLIIDKPKLCVYRLVVSWYYKRIGEKRKKDIFGNLVIENIYEDKATFYAKLVEGKELK